MIRIRYVLLASSLLACTGPTDPLTQSGLPRSTAQAVVGTWALQSWNGKATPSKYETHYRFDPDKEVPCTIPPYSSCPPDGKPIKGGFVEDYVVSIESSSITLNDDATYQRTVVWLTQYADGSPSARATESRAGSYTGSVAAGSVALTLYGGVRMQIAIAGNTMTGKIVVEQSAGPPVVLGDVWLYVK
jgi:hypothetical protein